MRVAVISHSTPRPVAGMPRFCAKSMGSGKPGNCSQIAVPAAVFALMLKKVAVAPGEIEPVGKACLPVEMPEGAHRQLIGDADVERTAGLHVIARSIGKARET